jgi:hypothetical protein
VNNQEFQEVKEPVKKCWGIKSAPKFAAKRNKLTVGNTVASPEGKQRVEKLVEKRKVCLASLGAVSGFSRRSETSHSLAPWRASSRLPFFPSWPIRTDLWQREQRRQVTLFVPDNTVRSL